MATRKNTQEPRRPLILLESCSPWFPECQLFFLCLPLLPATVLLPGKQKFLRARKGQRAELAWTGATRAASCQESSMSCHPLQGNPNKVTSPPEIILPFKVRLCSEARMYLWLDEDFIQPFTDTAPKTYPGPSAAAFMG
jgi:hypothetical protein